MDKQIKAISIVLATIFTFIILLVMCNKETDDEESITDVELSPTEEKDVAEEYEKNQSDNSIIINEDTSLLISKKINNKGIYEDWDSIEVEQANTAIRDNSFSKEEKDIILFTNLARLNGTKFCKLYVDPLLKSDPNNSYIKSLVDDLNKNKKLDILYPNDILKKAANYHAKDLGESGSFQHESTDGTSFAKRMMRFGFNKPSGENLYAGIESPLGVVLVLLIDDGIPGVGHRKNILDKNFNSLSVSRQKHNSDCRYIVVMDFGME